MHLSVFPYLSLFSPGINPMASSDAYHKVTTQKTYSYSYINVHSESIIVNLSRSGINIFFPMFMTIIMWMLIIAESMIFIPYYLEKKMADAPGTPLGCVGILFALPNIRNTLPGSPPLG